MPELRTVVFMWPPAEHPNHSPIPGQWELCKRYPMSRGKGKGMGSPTRRWERPSWMVRNGTQIQGTAAVVIPQVSNETFKSPCWALCRRPRHPRDCSRSHGPLRGMESRTCSPVSKGENPWGRSGSSASCLRLNGKLETATARGVLKVASG